MRPIKRCKANIGGLLRVGKIRDFAALFAYNPSIFFYFLTGLKINQVSL
jgi:hypothetical protein